MFLFPILNVLSSLVALRPVSMALVARADDEMEIPEGEALLFDVEKKNSVRSTPKTLFFHVWPADSLARFSA